MRWLLLLAVFIPALGCEPGDGAGEAENDPCTGPCEPPPPECADAVRLRVHYPDPGACASKGCTFSSGEILCPAGCREGGCMPHVAAGSLHTCALTAGGGVKCWGENAFGVLGDGTSADSATPVDVVGLGVGVAAVTAGERHACALTTCGGVKCWGRNLDGELGEGGYNTSSPEPIDVDGLGSGVTAISGAGYQTCALTMSGAVQCWGIYATLGQAGSPVAIAGLENGVRDVSAGGTDNDDPSKVPAGFGCAVTADNAVVCWGRNATGQLGDGSTTSSLSPVTVTDLAPATQVAAGLRHACALTTAGAVRCWGAPLANGSSAQSAVPVDVQGLDTGVSFIHSGTLHSCALATGGGARCWGGNAQGQLGDGSQMFSSVPVDVQGLNSGVAFISAGGSHTCAVTTSGQFKCWGGNQKGELGDGSTNHSNVPVDVIGL